MRILLPSRPQNFVLTNNKGEQIPVIKKSWDKASKTFYLSFDNIPDGLDVKISW
jgi:hypothetical protein